MSNQRAIAVVDDNHAVLESMSDLLASAGYAARTFSSAREFLDSGALHSIACLVSDLHLAGMDGWELQAVAHAQRPGLPIILITGDDETEREAQALLFAGRAQLLFKPFDAHELLDAARHALETRIGL